MLLSFSWNHPAQREHCMGQSIHWPILGVLNGSTRPAKRDHFVGIFSCHDQPTMVLMKAETKPRSGKPSHVAFKISSVLRSENVRVYGTILHKKASFLSMGGGGGGGGEGEIGLGAYNNKTSKKVR